MDNSKFTLPLLPNSIAVGLSEDLLQYLIELKFLLLFFDKPHCIFANAGLQFLSENVFDDIRNGKTPKTSPWEEDDDIPSSSLKNVDIVLTDEWQETLSHCQPRYHEINLTITNEKDVEGEKVYTDEIIDSMRLFEKKETSYFSENSEPSEEDIEKMLTEWAIRTNMQVMIDTLEMCCNEKIPMIWGSVADTVSASLYTKHLLTQYSKSIETNSEDEKTASFLRTLKGDDLLKSIFELGVVNLATVPVDRIIDFRKKNQDLLVGFLSSYRGFLTELQSEPLNYRKIVLARTQKITDELNTINMEILTQRKSEKYKWVERLSDGVYEGAKNGAMIALWNFLASPLLMTGQIGISLLSAANFKIKDMKDRRQLENALIFKSSSGYLWKAMEEFKN
ncbi:MAG: hypothetical protein HS100_19115 [Anaerolineales bacterium]|nr:hypothetical protein [Anaerolineales bacterium]